MIMDTQRAPRDRKYFRYNRASEDEYEDEQYYNPPPRGYRKPFGNAIN